jgi:hypothetical protein
MGDSVRRAQARSQATRQGDEQLIAHDVSETVVDHLETIEIQKEYSKQRILMLSDALVDVRQAFHEGTPIR